MTGRLAQIVRHPVKSVGFEEIASVTLDPDAALPWDRYWAIAHASADFGARPDGWSPKLNFVRGSASPQLMAVACQFDPLSGAIRLEHPATGSITLRPGTTEGAVQLIAWIRPLWPANRPDPAHLVHVPDQAMTDSAEPYVAVLNHASNRALGQRIGQDLSIHRWRGNLWLEGLAPWEEFDLIGHTIRIGSVTLRIEERITRCRATMGNPATGKIDADTLGALEEGYGHQDFGVFARVLTGGTIAVGDAVLP